MGRQKTIFDLFKREEENFSSQPSKDAWSKLEQKLDGKDVVPVRRINWWTLAACLVALVGAVYALNLNTNHNVSNQSAVASNEMSPEKFIVEDLVYQDDNSFDQEWKISSKYRAMFANYSADIAKNNKNDIADRTRKLQSRLNVRPSEVDRDDRNLAAVVFDEDSNQEHKVSSNISLNDDNQYLSQDSSNEVLEKYEISRYKVGRNSTIRTFDWLLGEWEQKRADLKSVENWVADSSNIIQGTGYLLQQDDTVFTENMRIEEIGGKLYFFQNINSTEELSSFVLVDSSQNNWIFQNASGTPKNVIFSNSGSSEYQIQIQQIAPSQTNFLRQRNVLQSNNAFRKMNRVE